MCQQVERYSTHYRLTVEGTAGPHLEEIARQAGEIILVAEKVAPMVEMEAVWRQASRGSAGLHKFEVLRAIRPQKHHPPSPCPQSVP